MVTLGVCDRMLRVDISEARVQDAFARIPADLTERVTFRVVDLEHWQPDERFDLVVAQDVPPRRTLMRGARASTRC
ncbi:MAG: hypothetical protein R2736_02600 [Solirubrobacterales bacterium]